MTPRPALGTIVPSSNRSVERTLGVVLRHFPDVDSCVARIPYHGDGLGQPADGYATAGYRDAAAMLAHAGCGALCWNGTKGAGLGLAVDEALCTAMREAAGVPATTAAIATAALLRRLGARRIGFVTPSPAAYAEAAARGLGVEVAAARGLGITDNQAAAAVDAPAIVAMAREVAAAAPDAVLLWGTNLLGVEVMAPLEAELGLPVLDSAAIGVRAVLDLLGVEAAPAAPLGRLFRLA